MLDSTPSRWFIICRSAAFWLLVGWLVDPTNAQEPEPAFQPVARFGYDFWDEPVSITSAWHRSSGIPLNSFFNRVNQETEQEITSLEVAKQHVLFASDERNVLTTGWRFEAYHDNWQAALGDEVRGLWRANPDALESISLHPLRNAIRSTRFSLYGTAGLRGIHHNDEFYFSGTGSILGRTTVEQSIAHYAIGPQLGLGLVAEASMFRFEAVALGLVGYGRVDNEQSGIFGEEAIPGALNRSATARTSRSAIESDEEHVAWHGETRVAGSCQLTQRLRFDATWRWFVTGPAYNAANSVAWNAPDFGFNQTPSGRFSSSDCFLGLTYTH